MSKKNHIKKYDRGGEEYYLVDFHLRGFRVRQRGFESREEASIILGKIRTEILLGTYNPVDYQTKKRQSQVTFEECLASWIKNNKSVKPSTKLNYRYTFNSRILPVFGKKKIEDVSGKYIQAFLYGIASKYSAGYASVCHTLLKSILGWAESLGVIESAPSFNKPKADSKKIKVFLSMNQIREMILYAYANPNVYETEFINAFRFTVLTGVRVGELRALRYEDIDLKKNLITIRRRIYRGSFGVPKNNKIQSIPLHKELIEVIDSQVSYNRKLMKTEKYKQHNHQEFFLSSHSGKRLCRHTFTERLKRLAKEAVGIEEGVSPHTLRRSLSEHLIESGLNINQVSSMLRNTNIVMLARYTNQNINSLTDTFNSTEISGAYSENW
jgi:integrase|tara:strand:- start:1683 stop:2831 length:1149 start_codon:yes stop_codon:yes gene_type:complete